MKIRIGYDAYNVLQRYGEGQGDDLYALLSRRGHSMDGVEVAASFDELEWYARVLEEVLESADAQERYVAEETLTDLYRKFPMLAYDAVDVETAGAEIAAGVLEELDYDIDDRVNEIQTALSAVIDRHAATYACWTAQNRIPVVL